MMEAGPAPVVIAGAGPTGMTAALDLAHYGIPCILLEEDHKLSDGSRAIAFHHTALAVWEKLGAAQPMLEKGIAWSARHTYYRQVKLYTQAFAQPGQGLLPRFFNLQQYYVERYLLDCVQASPAIDLRLDHRLVGIRQGEQTVSLEVETPAGRIQIEAQYVLACDGAHSSLRKLLNLEFPGATHDDYFLIADIRAALDFPHEPRFFFDHPTNPGQTILIHPQPDGVWRIDWQVGAQSEVEAERSPEKMDRRIRALIGETPYEIVWLSAYRFHQRLLRQLRHGRVFFLGDAAHLVAPFGARGLNSAVQDVENLAWKLALVLRNLAPAALLDTYQTERWAAQQLNQQVTHKTMLFMCPPNPRRRLERNLILRLSAFFPPARRWVNSGKMSEPYVYAHSPLSVPDQPGEKWPGSPAPGAMIADAACRLLQGDLEQPTHLRKLFGSGFVALHFARQASEAQAFAAGCAQADLPAPVTVYSVLGTRSANTVGSLNVLLDEDNTLQRAFQAQPGSLYLVRPDGHLAARRRAADSGQLAGDMRIACGFALRS
ncbi:MAG: FAD-dependent monooxygenase [Chloroflexota bacterium]